MKRLISILCSIFLIFTIAAPTQFIASADADLIKVGDPSIVIDGVRYKRNSILKGKFDFDSNGDINSVVTTANLGSKTVSDFATYTGLEDIDNHGNVVVTPGSDGLRFSINSATQTTGVVAFGYDVYYTEGTAASYSHWTNKVNGAWSTERTLLKFVDNTLVYNGQKICDIPVEQWININILFDIDEDKYYFIVDGVLVYSCDIANYDDVARFQINECWFGSSKDGVSLTDNLGVYHYVAVPYNAEISGLDAEGNAKVTVDTASGSKIAVKFDTAMDTDTFAGNITVKSASGVDVAVEDITPECYNAETNTLTLTLAGSLTSGETYYVHLDGVKNELQLSFAEEQKYDFLAEDESGYEYGMVVSFNSDEKTITIRNTEGIDTSLTYGDKLLVNNVLYEGANPKSLIPTGAFVKYLSDSSSSVKIVKFDETADIYTEIGYDEDNAMFTGLDFDITELPLYNRTGELSYDNDYDGTFSKPYLSKRYKYTLEIYEFGVNIKESVSLYKEYPVTNIVISEELAGDYTHDLTVTFTIEENPETLKYEFLDEKMTIVRSGSLVYSDYNFGDAGNKIVISSLPNVTTAYTLKIWVQDASDELLSQIYETLYTVKKVLTPDDKIVFGNQIVVIDGVEYQKSMDVKAYDFTNEGTVEDMVYSGSKRFIQSFAEFSGKDDTENHGDVLVTPPGDKVNMSYNSVSMTSGVVFIGFDFYYKDSFVGKTSFWSTKLNGSWSSERLRFKLGNNGLWDSYVKDESGVGDYQIAAFETNKWHNIYIAVDIDNDTYSWFVDGELVYTTPIMSADGSPIAVNSFSTADGYFYSGEGGVAMDNFGVYKYLPQYSVEVNGFDSTGSKINTVGFEKGSKIGLYFSVPMNSDSFAGNIVVTDANGVEVKLEDTFDYESNEKKLILTLAEAIQPTADYTVILKSTRKVDGKQITGVCTSNNVGYSDDIILNVTTSKPDFHIDRIRMGNITPGTTITPSVYLTKILPVDSSVYLALYVDGKLSSLSTAAVDAESVASNYPMSLTVPTGGTEYVIKAFLLGENYELLDVLTVQ